MAKPTKNATERMKPISRKTKIRDFFPPANGHNLSTDDRGMNDMISSEGEESESLGGDERDVAGMAKHFEQLSVQPLASPERNFSNGDDEMVNRSVTPLLSISDCKSDISKARKPDEDVADVKCSDVEEEEWDSNCDNQEGERNKSFASATTESFLDEEESESRRNHHTPLMSSRNLSDEEEEWDVDIKSNCKVQSDSPDTNDHNDNKNKHETSSDSNFVEEGDEVKQELSIDFKEPISVHDVGRLEEEVHGRDSLLSLPMDQSECDNSCWIPDLVEIKSLRLGNSDSDLIENITGQFSLENTSSFSNPNSQVTSSTSNIEEAIHQKSTEDNIFANYAQPDIFFSPIPIGESMETLRRRSSGMENEAIEQLSVSKMFDSTALKPFTVNFAVDNDYLHTPNEVLDKVMVMTSSKRSAVPFSCISSDSDSDHSSHGSNKSLNPHRDSIDSVDNMAERFGFSGPSSCTLTNPLPEDSAKESSFDNGKLVSLTPISTCVLSQQEVLSDKSTSQSPPEISRENVSTISSEHERISSLDTAGILAQISDVESAKENYLVDLFSYTEVANLSAIVGSSSESIGVELQSPPVTVNHSIAKSPNENPALVSERVCTPDALLSYSHLKDIVVPQLKLSSTSSIVDIESLDVSNMEMVSFLTSQGIELEGGMPSLKPVADLKTTEEVDTYNSHIAAAAAQTDHFQAAAHYLQALSICDADLKLHGKLAWLFSELKRR